VVAPIISVSLALIPSKGKDYLKNYYEKSHQIQKSSVEKTGKKILMNIQSAV
jgi:hypothetical protein